MNLSEYTQTHGNVKKLAKAINVSPVMVSQGKTGVRQVPAERCPDIEQATGGAVSCEELRPDVSWGVLRKASRKRAA